MKAMRPEPTPTWMPADPSTGRPGSWVGGKVTIPPIQGQEAVVQPTGNMPGYIRDAKGGIHLVPQREVKPPTLNPIDMAELKSATAAETKAIAGLKTATTPEERQINLEMLNWARTQRNVIAKRNGMAPNIPTPSGVPIPDNFQQQVETPDNAPTAQSPLGWNNGQISATAPVSQAPTQSPDVGGKAVIGTYDSKARKFIPTNQATAPEPAPVAPELPTRQIQPLPWLIGLSAHWIHK